MHKKSAILQKNWTYQKIAARLFLEERGILKQDLIMWTSISDICEKNSDIHVQC